MASEGIQRKHSAIWVALKSVKNKLSLTEEGATPVPWRMIFLVFISLFSSSFNITFLFPFLPEMILSFGYDETEKGYYAGIIASAMFIGRACGSYFWGAVSDSRGRRPVILLTVLLNGLSSLVFGFTTDIYFAFVTRFISGLVNGTVGTAKTILYEVTDNTNQAVGMSVISMAWGLGMIAGPTLGGYFANPCKRYPSVFPNEGFFYQFPYIFPGLAAFFFCIVAFIFDFFLLPETLASKKLEIVVSEPEGQRCDVDQCSLVSDAQLPLVTGHSPVSQPRTAPSVENLHVESEGATYLAGSRTEMHISGKGVTFTKLPDSDSDEDETENVKVKLAQSQLYIDVEQVEQRRYSLDKIKDRFGKAAEETPDIEENPDNTEGKTNVTKNKIDSYGDEVLHDQDVDVREPSITLLDCDEPKPTGCRRFLDVVINWRPIMLLRQNDVCLAVGLYSLTSFAVIGLEEIFTVWAATDRSYDGLQFAPNQIGAVLGATSLPLVVIQMFLFPHLIRRLEIKKTMIVCCLALTILFQALPCLHLLVNQPTVLWPMLLSLYTCIKLLISCSFSSTGLLINNSVEPVLAGSVNGLAMTLTAITRSIAPLFGGVVYTWTVKYAATALGPPFDVSLIFFLYGLVFWVCAVIGVIIPARLNKQKKVEKT